jgi:hypothetical protein
MRRSLLVILAALCVSACASAPPETTPVAAAEPAAVTAAPTAEPAATAEPKKEGTQVASADSEDKLICHDEPATGTHVRRPVRVCATAEEWARRREESQRALGGLGRRGGQSTVQGH